MNRFIAFATLAVGLGFGHAALAAPAATVAQNWSGFYAGVHGGWAWSSGAGGHVSGGLPGFARFDRGYDLNDNGPLFGGHLGFNWQFGAAVVGVEGDISGTGISGFQSGAFPFDPVFGGDAGGTSHMRRDVNWLASVRARLGYTFGPGLLYVTGGAAWANIDYSADANPTAVFGGCCAFPVAFSKTQSGWTIGGGYEWMLASSWSVRTEYLYYSFNGTNAVAPVIATPARVGSATYVWDDLDIHIVRVGASYKWGAGNPGSAAPAATVARNWGGIYAGVHGGWGWSSGAGGNVSASIPTFFDGTLFSRGYDLNDNGPLFGGQFGFNWQFGAVVFGIEGDISGTGISGFQSATVRFAPSVGGTGGTSHMRQDVNWLASIRARLGYAFGPGLLYVTGGAAWANIDYSADANSTAILGGCCAFPVAFSKTQSGWTIGGGYEWMLASSWSVRTEYLYYSFNGTNAVAPVIATPARVGSATYIWDGLDIHAARLALNYKW
jgi:outer membrane immunogenic protein